MKRRLRKVEVLSCAQLVPDVPVVLNVRVVLHVQVLTHCAGNVALQPMQSRCL